VRADLLAALDGRTVILLGHDRASGDDGPTAIDGRWMHVDLSRSSSV